MKEILPDKGDLRKIEPYLLPAVVVLVGLSAFGLGRLSVLGEGPRLLIQMPDGTQTASVQQAGQAAISGNFVASKSGTKYYLPSCSGASRIKEENKVWFASASAAEAAGYGPAANCAGL